METLKNVVYAGLGLAATTSEKVKETINDLVEKGKISDSEGKKIIEDFFKATEEKKEELESRVKKVSDSITSKFDFNNGKSDDMITSLKSKIEELESKLKESQKKLTSKTKETTAKAKETVKKATAKATK